MVRQTFRLEWDGHEYEHKERSNDWFWAVGIVTVSVAVTSIILGNIIFGILIMVAAFALLLFINRPPETVHVVIDERGVTRGNVLYPFETLEAFWIDINHPHKKIILRSKKTLMPLIIVPLEEGLDLEAIEDHLLTYLPAELMELPLAEKLIEYFGF